METNVPARDGELLFQALLATAGRIDGERPGLKAADLASLATLAMVRRSFLEKLSRALPGTGGLPPLENGEPLAGWWDFAKGAGCPLLSSDLDGKGFPDGRRAVLLAERPASEDAGQVYQSLKEVELRKGRGKGKLQLASGREERRQIGLFFTPDWMARRLAERALAPWIRGQLGEAGWRRLRILDPACGSGRLLLACLEVLREAAGDAANGSLFARSLVESVFFGVDRDPLAMALARSHLWLAADPRSGPVPELAKNLQAGDAIVGPLKGKGGPKGAIHWDDAFGPVLARKQGGFDLIIANPPFEVFKGQGEDKELKRYTDQIRKAGYTLALSGNVNTSRLFLERSLELLAWGGRLAFVLPYSFLMDRSAAPLRAHLVRSGFVEQIEVFPESSRVFAEVGQSLVLLWAEKRERGAEEFTVSDGSGQVPEHTVLVDQLHKLDSMALPIPVAPADAFGMAARMKDNNGATLGDLAEARVGEVDQTFFRAFMKSEPAKALLLRGCHLSPYRANLESTDPQERWLDQEGFEQERGRGHWSEDLKQPRVVQTGIVNLEAARRFVAAEVPAGIYLGNSVNYLVPRQPPGLASVALEPADLRGYLLGLLNSTVLEWRFRLTSSNNNVNLYEVRELPLPVLSSRFPAERLTSFVAQAVKDVAGSQATPLGLVRQITAGWGSPSREDRAVAVLIARVARLREREKDPRRCAWLEHILDHLVNWHLGMDEPDLSRMLRDVPARRWKEP